jgi:hypothetical protein
MNEGMKVNVTYEKDQKPYIFTVFIDGKPLMSFNNREMAKGFVNWAKRYENLSQIEEELETKLQS